MGHGSKYITSYVQKHIARLAICYDIPFVRDKPLGAPAFVMRKTQKQACLRLDVGD